MNLFMFVYAHTYVLGLTNEKYVMHMYVAYVWEQNWQRQRDREIDRGTAIMRTPDPLGLYFGTIIKHRGFTVPFFF